MRTPFGDWVNQHFPYDLASCGLCITDHARGITCSEPSHAILANLVRGLHPPLNYPPTPEMDVVIRVMEVRTGWIGTGWTRFPEGAEL